MSLKAEFNKATTTTKIIVVVVAIIIIYVGYNYFKTRAETLKGLVNNRSEKDALRDKGIVETSNAPFYKSVAEDLFFAMNGIGTDVDLINESFDKLKNDADVLAVEREFGLRDSTVDPFDDEVDLRAWLKDDLNAEQLKSLNSLLRTKGITKTF